ncbi:MAG: alpha/beta hydrolase [Betaproteobacteria bacterium]|nr:alpha/beta hydrolase [Betaproteobacteria bacterium]
MFESSRPDHFNFLPKVVFLTSMTWFRWAAVVLGTLLLSGCSSLDVLNAVSKSPQVASVTLSYGPSTRQRVEFYPASKTASGTVVPVIVFFYGGAWESGSRLDYRFIARTFNDLGYLVAIPDYRLTPEVTYPGFVEDSAAALRLIIEEAARFGGDTQRIVLSGHSAGAYNAISLATDPRWLTEAERRRIRGVIGLSSPVNFLPIQMPAAQRAFNWPNTPRDSQPIEHVSAASPPMLLLSAKRDPLVDPQINSATLAERLRAAGVYVKMEVYEGPFGLVSHSSLVASLSDRLSFLAPTIEHSKMFIEMVTR